MKYLFLFALSLNLKENAADTSDTIGMYTKRINNEPRSIKRSFTYYVTTEGGRGFQGRHDVNFF